MIRRIPSLTGVKGTKSVSFWKMSGIMNRGINTPERNISGNMTILDNPDACCSFLAHPPTAKPVPNIIINEKKLKTIKLNQLPRICQSKIKYATAIINAIATTQIRENASVYAIKYCELVTGLACILLALQSFYLQESH